MVTESCELKDEFMQSTLPRLTLLVALFIPTSLLSLAHAKAEDFFRLHGGGLLISGIGMSKLEVVKMINKESSAKKIGPDHYVLAASVGGKFDVQFKFNRGELTEIITKQISRVHH